MSVSGFKVAQYIVLTVLVVIFVTSGLLYSLGLRVNTTPSIPLGLYYLTGETIKKGDYVLFCPPQSPVFDTAQARGYIHAGFCPGGYGKMMKRVDAVPGDQVRVAQSGVWVNDHFITYSQPTSADLGGRPMPVYRTTGMLLNPDQYWLMGENAISFDGRYFGPINQQNIQGVIRPLYTWSS